MGLHTGSKQRYKTWDPEVHQLPLQSPVRQFMSLINSRILEVTSTSAATAAQTYVCGWASPHPPWDSSTESEEIEG